MPRRPDEPITRLADLRQMPMPDEDGDADEVLLGGFTPEGGIDMGRRRAAEVHARVMRAEFELVQGGADAETGGRDGDAEGDAVVPASEP